MIQEKLFALSEQTYKEFSSALMPTVDPARVLGVRVPHLRRLAKTLRGTAEEKRFLASLPHTYHEENMLHALLLNEFKVDFDKINRFLPFVDNWAVCDSLRPRISEEDKDALLTQIGRWLGSVHPYTVRFGIEMLMLHFLGEDFDECYLSWVASVKSEEYYVNMLIAWFFATALTVRYEDALPYLTEKKLSPGIHNKTIQKAVESLQIPNERKDDLKTLKMGRKETL